MSVAPSKSSLGGPLSTPHAGLHQHPVDRMAAVQRSVMTPGEVPITAEVWDEVVSTLAGVLLGYGVLASVVEPLGALLGPLRAVIVAGP